MSNPNPTPAPVTYGAIDLSGLADKPKRPTNNAGDIHVVVDATSAEWQSLAELSHRVPVVLSFWSENDAASVELDAILQDVASSHQGRILLARVNADAEVQIAQAFQIQSTPVVFALIKGRPLPLFQGVVTRSEIDAVMTQLLQACQQAGVTGTIEPQPADNGESVEPPEEYALALAARQAGDTSSEIVEWKKVLTNFPADNVAKQNLAEAQMRLRLSEANADTQDPLLEADYAFAQGNVEKC